MKGNQYFILPEQPAADDNRPRNAFGFLLGFGEAYKAYYDKQDQERQLSERQQRGDKCDN